MNEIELPADQIDYREREAANADDASSIRARATPPANEPAARDVPGQPASPVDDPTRERLKKIREADRRKVEDRLRSDAPTDDAVKPAAGTGKPLGKRPSQRDSQHDSQHDGHDDNTIRPKPIFAKTGYDVPKSVSDRYVAFEGKFLDRRSEAVHFEDRGRSLATGSEDRDVIAHMVEVAKAKHWGELQLKGSDEFCRQAWIAAELAGVPTRGYRPNAQDRAALQAAREAMRIAAGERPADGERARTNTVESAAVAGRHPAQTGPSRDAADFGKEAVPATAAATTGGANGSTAAGTAGTRTDPPGPDRAEPGQTTPTAAQPASAAVDRAEAAAAPKQDQPARRSEATSAGEAPTPPGATAGVLLAHGAAPFNHDPKQSGNYYATVRTTSGDRTVWGLDLERAIAENGVQVGQRIELEKGGSKTVTALQRQFDESGRELEPKPVTSRRNEWLVSSPDVPGPSTREQRQALAGARREGDERRRIQQARERFLSGNWKYTKEQQATLEAARERIKEQAARQVLEEEIRDLPEAQQEQLRGEFESAVAGARAANRPLGVPMPQVSEATIEAVREQIEREGAARGVGQQRADQHGHEQSAQEIEHGTPTLEIDP